MSTTLVSAWLRQLRPIRHANIRAYKNTRWHLLDHFPQPLDWTADEARLVLLLFRPAARELKEFVEEVCGLLLDEDPEEAEGPAAVVFREYLRKPFSEPGLTRPTQLFVIDTLTNGACTSSSFGWRAIALTDELALLCEDFDEFTLGLFPRVLGVIDRSDITRSAALLVRAAGERDHRFGPADGFYSMVEVEGISPTETYRILLANCRCGGTRILTMAPRQLRKFRNRRMVRGFDALRAVMVQRARPRKPTRPCELPTRDRPASGESTCLETGPASGGSTPIPVTPFDLATCMLVLPPDEADRAAFMELGRVCPTPESFWNASPSASWMLKGIGAYRGEIQVPARELRMFALEMVSKLDGVDTPLLREVVAAIRGTLDHTLDVRAMEAARERARGYVTACGVQGLPRCVPAAAGALAVWHAAAPDVVDGALTAVDFAVRHDAFSAAWDAAKSWHAPQDPGEQWRESWHIAAFAAHHPAVMKEALAAAQRRYADLLRAIVPNPFGRPGAPVRAEVYFEPDDDSEYMQIYCEQCGKRVPGANRGVLLDARGYGCSRCRTPFDVAQDLQ